MVAPPNGLFRLAKIFGNFVNVARPRDNATGRNAAPAGPLAGAVFMGMGKPEIFGSA